MEFKDNDHLELTDLCNALVDETITAAQLNRLQAWLAESEDARRFYVRFMGQDASLCGYAAEMQADPADASISSESKLGAWESGQPQGIPVVKAPLSVRRILWPLSVIAASLLILLFYASSLQDRSRLESDSEAAAQSTEESMDNGVAVLTRTVGAVWDQDQHPSIGDTFPLGVLHLKSGLAQIEFYSGALMLLEGPAELEFLSADQCFCRGGKLRVTVPRSAQGFTVFSPEIETVDLGTEFGLDVSPQGETQVHVFDGKVELYPPGTQRAASGRIELLAGAGRRIERSGESDGITAAPSTFVSMEELDRRSGEADVLRERLWRQHTLAMAQDPQVVAFYDFEVHRKAQDRVLHNQGTHGSDLDGAIVGCEWSEGRWPGKQALDFKRPGDRVCIHVPGEYDALTLASWIRVDGLDRKYLSLMLTDGYEAGEVHWQILRTGKLRLGICHTSEITVPGTRDGAGHDYDSPKVFDLPKIGQWVHVAVVVDPVLGVVKHFANGRELSREALHEVVKFRIGDAQIGNWKPYRHGMMIRNFNGRMDEFMIVGKALSYEDIQDLYKKGNPL